MPVTAVEAVNVLNCFRMSAATRLWEYFYSQLQLMRMLEPAWRGSGTAVTRAAQAVVSGSFCSGCRRPWRESRSAPNGGSSGPAAMPQGSACGHPAARPRSPAASGRLLRAPGALEAREAAIVPATLRHRRVNKKRRRQRDLAARPGAARNADKGRGRGGGERGARPKWSLGARGAGAVPAAGQPPLHPPAPRLREEAAAAAAPGDSSPRQVTTGSGWHRPRPRPAPPRWGCGAAPAIPGAAPAPCPRRAGNRGRRRAGPEGPARRRRRSGVRRGRGGEPGGGGGPRAGCPASRPAGTGQRGAPRGTRHETVPPSRRPSQVPVGVQTPAGFRCTNPAVSAAGARRPGARRGAPSASWEGVRPSPCSRDVGRR